MIAIIINLQFRRYYRQHLEVDFTKDGDVLKSELSTLIINTHDNLIPLMIGTDSHTVNAGGLGMIAIGVGGADAFSPVFIENTLNRLFDNP